MCDHTLLLREWLQLPSGDQIAGATSYRLPDPTQFNLPKFPIRMLISTAENKHYDVIIHAASNEKGIDFEYRPVDPSLLPKNIPDTQPNDADTCYKKGIDYAKNGQTIEALAQFQAALELKPNFPEAHNNLGLALAQTGRLQEAIEHFQKALRLKPDSPEALNNLGDVFSKIGRQQEAIAFFQQALLLKPDYLKAHSNLALALEKLKRPEEAKAAAQKALKLALTSKTSPAPEVAEYLLRNYAETVWKELPPKLDKADLSHEEASKIAIQTSLDIATRLILPQKDLVDQYLMDKLQKAPPIDQSIWDSASVINIPESIKVGPEWKEGFWNPITVFYSCQNMALIEKLGQEKTIKYLVLGSCAPVPTLLVDNNLDRPEFVTIYPNFLIIYRFCTFLKNGHPETL